MQGRDRAELCVLAVAIEAPSATCTVCMPLFGLHAWRWAPGEPNRPLKEGLRASSPPGSHPQPCRPPCLVGEGVEAPDPVQHVVHHQRGGEVDERDEEDHRLVGA